MEANRTNTATWTKLNNCWMVKVTGPVVIDGDFLEFTVTKADGSAKVVMTMSQPERVGDGWGIYCPIKSMKFSDVAGRNARANALADGGVKHSNGGVYVI